MTGPIDPLDLPILARRGGQDVSVERRVRMLLGASSFERDLFSLGESFDAVGSEPGDSALLDRVVSLAALPFAQPRPEQAAGSSLRGTGETHADEMAPSSRQKSFSSWGRALGAKLALVLVAAAASAAIAYRSLGGKIASSESCESCAQLAERQLAQDYEMVAPGLIIISEDPTSTQRPESGSALASTRREGPASLFREANRARREGATQRALSIYRELQMHFPNSREAATSYVMSGRLLLDAKSSGPACREFAAYLKRFPQGALAAEALHGQVMCARQSGDVTMRQHACEQLLEGFRNSAYSSWVKECGEAR